MLRNREQQHIEKAYGASYEQILNGMDPSFAKNLYKKEGKKGDYNKHYTILD